MGVELYISRAELPSQNDEVEISIIEWLDLVASDSELTILSESDPYCAVWSGGSKHEKPWFEWSNGNIETKWPDTELFKKMLQLASNLNAKIRDGDGGLYASGDDWVFDPTAQTSSYTAPKKEFDLLKFVLIIGLVGAVLRIIFKELKVF
jgi:hypothetical protein